MCVGIGHGAIHKRRKMRQNTKGKKQEERRSLSQETHW